MTDTRKLEISLLTMRLSVGVFFLVWAIQKTVAPEMAQRVFETFYFSSPAPTLLMLTGLAQLAIVIAFMAGLFFEPTRVGAAVRRQPRDPDRAHARAQQGHQASPRPPPWTRPA